MTTYPAWAAFRRRQRRLVVGVDAVGAVDGDAIDAVERARSHRCRA
jgi:hypothetical protein